MSRLSFSSPEKQAAKMAAAVGRDFNKELKSVRTTANYQQALKNVALAQVKAGKHLRDITPERAQAYLENRASEVGQKQLDMERQAVQKLMQITGALNPTEKLAVTKSHHEQKQESRAYSKEQVSAIAARQTEKNALATQVAYTAGLRAHELLTLQKAEQRPADPRPSNAEKFSGREGQIYTVDGKGGLVREVLIPNNLAEKLEEKRLEVAQTITDRGVHYKQHYDIGGGQRWSASFSKASNARLGWSSGAHGLRHSYAQERLEELQEKGFSYERALETVSQEMGHFRPEITEVYLR